MACIKQVAVVNPKGDESPSDPEKSEHDEDAGSEDDLDDVEASLDEVFSLLHFLLCFLRCGASFSVAV